MIRLTLAAAAALACLTTGALADPPSFDWQGFYLGLNVGVALGNDDVRDVDELNEGDRYSITNTAVIGGGQFGYNFMTASPLLVGVEADIGAIDFNARKYDPGFVGGTFSGIQAGFNGDATARLGWDFNDVLVYAKGGFALYDGRAFVDNHLGGYGGGRAFTPSPFSGWTIGGGLEYPICPNCTVKVEYRYYDWGSQNATLMTPDNGNYRYSNRLTASTIIVGFNYFLRSF